MASIRHLLGDVEREKVYEFKDRLKDERTLTRDPMRLNRTQFDRYLRAKAAAIVQEQMSKHDDLDLAYHKARVAMTLLDGAWRQEAKRINEASHS